MTLLTIIEDVCASVGVAQPTYVIGNIDQDITQLLQLANLEGKALADEYDWTSLIKEATFTTVATESQGDVTTIAPGFKKFINESQWNRSTIYPMSGSMSPQQYQMDKARGFGGIFSKYRVRGTELLMYPVPAAGDTVAFEYITKNWVSKSDETDAYPRWALDSDFALLDEDVITLGVIWRWLRAKNFDYAEEFRQYEIRKNNAMSRDGGKERKGLAPLEFTGPILPHIKEGNWDL